jgi:hypothetical protein
LDTHSYLDPVYWINEHLKKEFQLDLANFSNWDTSKHKVKLWHWRGGAMSALFKSRMKHSGFPNYKDFSFHSFRSGFLCAAIIKAGNVKSIY